MKILTVVGARPQFIKAAQVSPILRRRHTEILVHTGQHYDYEMSKIFFEGLALPDPDYQLNLGSGSPIDQISRMTAGLNDVLEREKPDGVLVYGDTNSTAAAALTAAYRNIPLIHVEAGLRSFNREMPEEINRIIADRLGGLLLCPTPTAMAHLEKEGLGASSRLVGDVMIDLLIAHRTTIGDDLSVLNELGVRPGEYLLVTIHRPVNTDDPVHLQAIVDTLIQVGRTCVFPLHPRTKKQLEAFELMDRLQDAPNIIVTPALGYSRFLQLQSYAAKVVTDSGGVQKEAAFLGIPCVTLRQETEWPETLSGGFNVLAGCQPDEMISAINAQPPAQSGEPTPWYCDGKASERAVEAIDEFLRKGVTEAPTPI